MLITRALRPPTNTYSVLQIYTYMHTYIYYVSINLFMLKSKYVLYLDIGYDGSANKLWTSEQVKQLNAVI